MNCTNGRSEKEYIFFKEKLRRNGLKKQQLMFINYLVSGCRQKKVITYMGIIMKRQFENGGKPFVHTKKRVVSVGVGVGECVKQASPKEMKGRK